MGPSNVMNKPPPPLPPPNKAPPPPPPPPLPLRPPRDASLGASNPNASQILASSATLLNNGSSMSSLNLAGRCGHAPTLIGPPASSATMTHAQRNFIKMNDNCSSRSSVSSHSSAHRHHHIGCHNSASNGASSNVVFASAGSCSNSGLQHDHNIPSSFSDNGSCNPYYNHDNRNCVQTSLCNGHCAPSGTHFVHNSSQTKCQNSSSASHNSVTRGAIESSSMTSSRNPMYFNPDKNNIGTDTGTCGNVEAQNRAHCMGASILHHHHHHDLHAHAPQLSSSSSLSSLQPVDSASIGFHRCTGQPTTLVPHNDLSQRPSAAHHAHRAIGCGHHHDVACCCSHHNHNSIHAQQGGFDYSNCVHSDNGSSHHDYNTNSSIGDGNMHHHYPPELMANRLTDPSNGNSLSSTAHTHNLSNSSTTTHTSNVAVRCQPQFHKPALSRGGRSNSSQQYDQYGQSSAASTSSATASLSSYQTTAGFDDLVPLFPSSKIHQPLPPPPPHIASKSRPPSPPNYPPAHMSMNSNAGGQNGVNQINNGAMNNDFANQVPRPDIAHLQQYQQHQNSQQAPTSTNLPPLPPKPVSPNASSCSTQITTVRSSPSLQNQPVTRVTFQAGVQNPLPSSDIPPPLPPLSSRSQPLASSNLTRNQNPMDFDVPPNPIPNFMNLNLTRNAIQMETERKTDTSSRRVESAQQQKQSDQLGSCPKCNNKVLPTQEACKAMNQIYHVACFVCCRCSRTLLGKTFYPVGDKVYCEEDFKHTEHMQSLKKCAACMQPIFNMILPAMGKYYHPKCFKCCICDQCLDGVQFTIDRKNKIYCVKDYHSIYSPKCAACGKPISPIDATGETIRVVSMEKDYHIDCFCCEDCGSQLTDEESSQSYPLDNHLLCQRCHLNRLASKRQAPLSLVGG